MRWLHAVVIALNQLGNAVLGGQPDMTISARAGIAREHGSGFARGACNVLDWLDPRDGDAPQGDHCVIAVRNYHLTKEVKP